MYMYIYIYIYILIMYRFDYTYIHISIFHYNNTHFTYIKLHNTCMGKVTSSGLWQIIV